MLRKVDHQLKVKLTYSDRSQRQITSTNTTTKNLKSQKVCLLAFPPYNCCLVDEIPTVLLELNESAIAYITREQFEKALLLLQKAHGVLDVVDLTGSQRD